MRRVPHDPTGAFLSKQRPPVSELRGTHSERPRIAPRSQQPQPLGHVDGPPAQSATRHRFDCSVSQKVASVSAQSASLVHVSSSPSTGLQSDVAALLSQRQSSGQSAWLRQPSVVQKERSPRVAQDGYDPLQGALALHAWPAKLSTTGSHAAVALGRP